MCIRVWQDNKIIIKKSGESEPSSSTAFGGLLMKNTPLINSAGKGRYFLSGKNNVRWE